MLKIKDDVDLKELKKFGYRNDYENDYEKVLDYAQTLWVECDTRVIWLEDSMSCIEDDHSLEPYIQDLIKADLVEKIREKEEK